MDFLWDGTGWTGGSSPLKFWSELHDFLGSLRVQLEISRGKRTSFVSVVDFRRTTKSKATSCFNIAVVLAVELKWVQRDPLQKHKQRSKPETVGYTKMVLRFVQALL